VLVNADARVYAEVSQSRGAGRTLPVATTLVSVLGEGWTLQTTSRGPSPIAVAFMRTPRAMWRSLPGATPQDLLADHLELRERATRDLGMGVGGDGSLTGWFTQQQIDHQARRAALVATNVVRGIARGIACERCTPTEWLGEYARIPARPAAVEPPAQPPAVETAAGPGAREPHTVA
jgi:hypothetical protein